MFVPPTAATLSPATELVAEGGIAAVTGRGTVEDVRCRTDQAEGY
jgi:hypothetical protein